jgi:hypothetical protein
VKVSRDAAGDAGPSPSNTFAAGSASSESALRARLDRLRDLGGAALREEWRRLCRSVPPRLSSDLLRRAIAHQVQELELGGLPKWARQSLAGGAVETPSASTASAAETRSKPPEASPLKPGSRLVREWRRRTHVVTVFDDAFEFEGRHYRSLTQIAREITSAHWSGPRFFGLTKRSAGAGSDAVPAPEAAALPTINSGDASGPAPSKRREPSVEVRTRAGEGETEAQLLGQRATESGDG